MTTAHALQTPSTPRNYLQHGRGTQSWPPCQSPHQPSLRLLSKRAFWISSARTPASRANLRAKPTPTDCGSTKVSHLGPNVGVSAGGDVNRAHFAAASGHDKKTGITMELGAVSAALGDQNELAAVFEQVSVETAPLTDAERRKAFVGLAGKATAEALSAKAHLGFHNADGSVGLNIGASAVLVNAEGTVDVSLLGGVFEGSFTAGAGFAKAEESSA